MDAFLNKYGVAHDQWDLLLFGDGAGASWKIGGGFASILFDGRTGERAHIIGGQSLTTVNRMELSAYTQGLAYHFGCMLDGHLNDPPYHTYIFSDSEITVKIGRGEYLPKKNRDLWQLIHWYELQGYRFTWRWVPRNSTPYHEFADYLAGTARHAVTSANAEGEIIHNSMPYSAPKGEEADIVLCEVCKTPLASEGDTCPICGPSK